MHKNEIKIYARECDVSVNVGVSKVRNLLNEWHLQGAKGSNNNICLTYRGDVVAILTYGTPRYGDEDVEILRYATIPNASVVGGFSKTLKALTRTVPGKSVVSFSDNRWGIGNVYARANFTLANVTPPSYFYFKNNDKIRYHRTKFMKKFILEQMGGIESMTEYENMKKFGYNRIFDCGTTKWVYYNKGETE